MRYSRISGVTRYSGGTIVLREGMSADDDHPLVAERPDLFTDVPPPADLQSAGRPVVERATRAPGEVREVALPAAVKRGPGRPRKIQSAGDDD